MGDVAKSRGTKVRNAPERTVVAKTLKLYLGGVLVRSESGATFPVAGFEVPDASRKDVRDAVRSGASAASAWGARDAYNRGQILYRVAEMLESRSGDISALQAALGVDLELARADVASAVDTWVHYAGWADKLGQVFATVNDVAGPFVSFTAPRPLGLVGAVIDPAATPLLTPVSEVFAAALAAGNSVIAVGGGNWSAPALTFCEVLETSDVPAGVVQMLASSRAEVPRTLSMASQVAGLDCSLAGGLAGECALAGADTFTRVLLPSEKLSSRDRLSWQLERQTFWHPSSY